MHTILCCADLGLALPGYWWITIQRREEAEIGFSLCVEHIGGLGSKLFPIRKTLPVLSKCDPGKFEIP